MHTALQLNQIIRQLTEENIVLVESYAEFLLHQQKEGVVKTRRIKNKSDKPVSERLKIARQFKGKAKFPNTETDKYVVYEQ